MYNLKIEITNDEEDEDESYELEKEYESLEDLSSELIKWINNDFELKEDDDEEDDDKDKEEK